MAIDKIKLANLLEDAFPDSEIILTELVNDGDHYSVSITSKDFKNKSRIEQHKMVNNSLKEYLGTSLHALQIKTYVKEEK